METKEQHPQQVKLEQGLAEIGLSLSAEQIKALLAYMDLIAKWNKVYNLTALRAKEDMLTHHLLDCLSIIPALDAWQAELGQAQPRLLDVGSGAGLPGLILAICRPDWQIETIDTVGKKAAFMQQAASHLALKNVRVHHNRVEKLAQTQADFFDGIISRAFASLPDFMQLCQGLLKSEGSYIAMKAKAEEKEDLAQFAQMAIIEQDIGLKVPFLDAERRLLFFKPRG